MAVNRAQIRSLLMPGILQRGARRGVPFTEEEVDAVVDAYIQSFETGGRGIDGAIATLDRLDRISLDAARRQRHLVRLRSVSAAYRKAQVPEPFRTLWADPVDRT